MGKNHCNPELHDSEMSAFTTYNCQTCGRYYGSKGALKRHENSHSLQQSHVCTYCGLRFHRQDLLARHRQIHTAKDEFHLFKGRQRSIIACEFCRKSKRKCNGEVPCACCRRAKGRCVYSQHAHRLSLRASSNTHVDEEFESGFTFGDAVNLLTHISTVSPNVSSPRTEETLIVPNSAKEQTAIDVSAAASAFHGLSLPSTEGQLDFNLVHQSYIPLHESDEQDGDPFRYDTSESTVSDQYMDSLIWSDSIIESGHLLYEETIAAPSHNSRQPQRKPTIAAGQQGKASVVTDTLPTRELSFWYGSQGVSSPSTDGLFETQRYRIMLQQSTLETHIEFAINNSFLPLASDRVTRAYFRRRGSEKADCAFDLARVVSNGSGNILDGLISIYFEKFHPRYAIFWQQGFDSYSVSSVIFLSMVSIGCAFAGQAVSQYGAALHNCLTSLFMAWFAKGVDHDQGLLFLIFGFLTESGELLFPSNGNNKIDELHAIIINHARSIGAFSHINLYRLPLKNCVEYTAVPGNSTQQWLEHEMKNRVVLAILQNDRYVAKIRKTPPLVKEEETDVAVSCPYETWRYIGHDWCRLILDAAQPTS